MVTLLFNDEQTEEWDDVEQLSELAAINANTNLSTHYNNLARDLDVVEPKTPEDVYKSHLVERRGTQEGGLSVDSARQNMANSFVSGFVNAGHLKDKLVTLDTIENPDGSKVSSFPPTHLISRAL